MRKKKHIVIIDGTRMELHPVDVDKDNITGGTEKVHRASSNPVMPVTESTELKDALEKFNLDEVKGRLSSMDFLSRIDKYESTPMIALDSLIGMQIIPQDCGILNRVKMRKSVSINGEGRKEFVDIVVGKKDQDMQKGLAAGFKNFVGVGDKQ